MPSRASYAGAGAVSPTNTRSQYDEPTAAYDDTTIARTDAVRAGATPAALTQVSTPAAGVRVAWSASPTRSPGASRNSRLSRALVPLPT